jgi:hypothetical protein
LVLVPVRKKIWSRSPREKSSGPGRGPGEKSLRSWFRSRQKQILGECSSQKYFGYGPGPKRTFWSWSCSEKILVLVLVKKDFGPGPGPGPGKKKILVPVSSLQTTISKTVVANDLWFSIIERKNIGTSFSLKSL